MAIGVMGKWIQAFGVGLLKNWILKPLATVSSVLMMWGFNSLVKASPGRAKWIADKVVKQYFQTDAIWSELVSSYMAQMGVPIDAAALKGKPLSEISKAVTQERKMREIMEGMLMLVMPSPEEVRTDPLKGAEKFLSTNMKFQMDAWMLHMLGDMQSFGIFKSLKDLPNAISWSFGIGWLSWLVMGTPFRIGTAQPMEKYWNRIYLQTELTAAQLVAAMRQGLIGPRYYDEKMDGLGYDFEERDLLFKLAKRELSETKMRDLYRRGMITLPEVEQEYRSMGYSESYAKALRILFRTDRYFDIWDDIVKEATSLYETGGMTEGDLRGYLEKANWEPEDINLQIVSSNITKSRRSQLSDSDFARLVRQKVLTWLQAREKLQQRGYSRDDADMYLKVRIPREEWF